MARTPRRPLAPKSPDMGGGSFGEVPTFTGQSILADMGSTGLRAFGGYVREEFIQELIGRQGATVYREMFDNSPIVGAMMFATLGIMRKVEWRTEAVDESAAAQEAQKYADSLRFDMSVTWEDFITEALSELVYGYAPMEIVYKRRMGPQPHRRNGPYPGIDNRPSSKYDDGMIGWKKIGLRSQDTLLKWFFDPNGEILGLTQQPWIGPLIDIPIEKLLLFRPSQHKNNPEGKSILRNSYISYYYTKRLQELESIYIERMAGNVIIRVPNSILEAAGASPPDPHAVVILNMYKNMATRSRTHEQMGIVLPSDCWTNPATGAFGPPLFSYEYAVPQGGARQTDANVPIVRHKLDMLTSILADFIQMGHTTRGAQNLADTKVDLFMQSVEGWLDGIAAVLNQHGLARIWDLNGLDPNLMPEFVPDMAQQINLDILSNFILRMSQSGVQMFPDDDLESYVRDVAGLPDAPEGRSWEAQLEAQAGEQPASRGKNTAKSIVDAFMANELRTRKRRASK